MSSNAERFPHYFRTVPNQTLDVYRVLLAFDVTDPCLQHALKKILACGKRGAKDASKDIDEAIRALNRWHEMREEEEVAP